MELNFDSLKEGKLEQIDINGAKVCVARVGEEVFAISDVCSHGQATLSEGETDGFKIECWLHGAQFDLRTGEALTPPAVEPLQTFAVTRDGNTVTISTKSRE